MGKRKISWKKKKTTQTSWASTYVRHIFHLTLQLLICKTALRWSKNTEYRGKHAVCSVFSLSIPNHVILTQARDPTTQNLCGGSCAVDSPYSSSFGSTITSQQKEVIVLIHRWKSEMVTKETGLVWQRFGNPDPAGDGKSEYPPPESIWKLDATWQQLKPT